MAKEPELSKSDQVATAISSGALDPPCGEFYLALTVVREK
jgi:hypothetical protein